MILGIWVLAGLPGIAGAAVTAPPRHIVSINLCTDALLLALVPRSRIAALSHLATDPRLSPVVALARGIPQVHGAAEEVLALDPDLVVAGRYTTRETVLLLRRLGIDVVELGLPTSMNDVRRQIREFAQWVGEPGRGERVVAALDARLSAAAPDPGTPRPLAAIYGPNGYTAGPRTLEGAVLRAAGYANLAGRAGIETWGWLPLEGLLRGRPQLLVFEETGHAPDLAHRVLAHPALVRVQRSIAVTSVPGRLWSCAGPWVGEAVQRLARLRQEGPVQGRGR